MTAQVIVGAVTPRVQYVADGWQTAFPFPFVIFKPADLQVWIGGALLASGYTVGGVASSGGGSVTLATPPPAGTLVTLRRKLSIERLTDFQEGGAFRAKVINDQLDFLTAALQELEAELARAVTLAPAAPAPASLRLPPVAPGKAIGWADDGQGLVNDPTDFTTTVQVVQQWATDAEGAVRSAQDAAVAAGGSASAAAGSAATATARASAAAASAAAAAASDSAAAASRLAAQAARAGAEGFAAAAAYSAWLTGAERQAAVTAAEEAAAQAVLAAGRATQALARLEDVDIALWRAERAARRAEAALVPLTTTAVTGIGPAAVLPNWARTE
ncbi:hypothetical protein ACM64Y_11000 [Novispirillum sp. DQ9]|uniref:hypothetical protein n=1 Tax=Novispirillum sp. DQ9 TaxID=3398612 RepID=UPI003C7AB773